MSRLFILYGNITAIKKEKTKIVAQSMQGSDTNWMLNQSWKESKLPSHWCIHIKGRFRENRLFLEKWKKKGKRYLSLECS